MGEGAEIRNDWGASGGGGSLNTGKKAFLRRRHDKKGDFSINHLEICTLNNLY